METDQNNIALTHVRIVEAIGKCAAPADEITDLVLLAVNNARVLLRRSGYDLIECEHMLARALSNRLSHADPGLQGTLRVALAELVLD